MNDTPARRLLPLFAGMAAILAASGHAAARDQFQFGAWRGTAYPRFEDGFKHCTMSARYRGGNYLMFRITRRGGLQVGLRETRWSLRRGDRFPVTFAVDGAQAYRGTAVAVTRDGVWIPVPSTRWMMQKLRWGRVLRIHASGATYSYKLTGTALALQRLLHCVKSELAVEAGRPRPAFVMNAPQRARPRAAGTTSAAGATAGSRLRLKATTLMANLFNRAGLTHLELVDPDQKPASMKKYDVVWKGPNLIGGMRIMRGSRSDAQKLGATLIAQDALVCKGQFSSGIKSNRSTKAAGTVRLFTACQAPTGWNALYSILPLSKGGLILITQLATGSLARLQEVDERMFNALPTVLEK